MAEIKPFRGIVYNQDIIQNLSSVIAPPYDVISEAAREKLYQNSPYNIIRLIKGKTEPNDSVSHNQYTRSAEFFQAWFQKGILTKDPENCLYAMEDEYTIPGSEKKSVRQGFMTLVKLEDFDAGKILPHERTLSKPKEDRLRLIKASKANLSPIFAMYSDPHRKTNTLFQEAKVKTEPSIDLLSQERIIHRVWRVSSPRLIEEISKEMKSKSVLIADGHHRYETALNYWHQMQGHDRASYVMMYLANMDDPGLTVLAYHRLLKNLPKEMIRNWRAVLRPFFRIESFSFDGFTTTEFQAREKVFSELAQKGKESATSYGLYLGDRNYHLLSLRKELDLQKNILGDQPLICKQLDVTILDRLIVNKVVNLEDSAEKEKCLGFSHDALQAISAVNSEKYQMALFLNPTKIRQVYQIASIGQTMPQKSTFFYPKLPTGLILRKIEDILS